MVKELGRFALAAIVLLGQITATAAPSPLCSEAKEDDDGCWLPAIVNNSNRCYAWQHEPPDADGEVSLAFTGVADCRRGVLHGDGTLTLRLHPSDPDADFWFERTWVGVLAAGRRHGAGTSTWGLVTDESPPNTRREEVYGNGRLHGPFKEWTGNDAQASGNFVRGKLHGDYRHVYTGDYRGGYRTDGQYVQGSREGRWVTGFGDGGSHEFRYLDDEKHGLSVRVSPAGHRWEMQWTNGEPYEGQWVRLTEDGTPGVTATFVAGKVKSLEFPQASLPEGTPPSGGRAPVVGAFGISLGPAGANQLVALRCLEPVNWASAPSEWTNDQKALPCASLMAAEDSLWAYLQIEEPPQPIGGGQRYYVRAGSSDGISEISAHVGQFESEEACGEEEVRIETILRDKYGQCKDYRYEEWQRGHSPVGQCDRRGLPEREIIAYCDEDEAQGRHFLRLSYEVVDDWEREEMIEAWMREAKPNPSEL